MLLAAVAIAAAFMGCKEKNGGSANGAGGAANPDKDFDVELTEDSQGVVIKKFLAKDKKSVIVPDTVEGLPVVKIYNSAFYGEDSGMKLKSVVLPNSVKEVDAGAFVCCQHLEDVVLPDSLQEISDSLFEDCKSLKSITLPDSVKRIGAGAFKGCTSLAQITLPSSIKVIGDDRQYGAFEDCTALKEVIIPDGVQDVDINRLTFTRCTALSLAEQKKLKDLGYKGSF